MDQISLMTPTPFTSQKQSFWNYLFVIVGDSQMSAPQSMLVSQKSKVSIKLECIKIILQNKSLQSMTSQNESTNSCHELLIPHSSDKIP